MKRENLNLYFIAVVPGEPVFTEVMDLKTEIRDRFNSNAALRSPPHITLHMPFQWQEEKEELLITSLDKLATNQLPFSLELANFGAFPPRVIYIHVIENELLSDLQNAVQKNARSNWHIYPKPDSRPFKPHITVAFRDLKKPLFFDAWKEFEQRNYTARFEVNNVCLLKHSGKTWDILHKAGLQ